MPNKDRDSAGKFVKGCTGGPGRPARAVERNYLLTLADAVSLDDWRAIVARARVDALRGGSEACRWLARYLLGANPTGLLDAAALSDVETTEQEIQRRATKIREDRMAQAAMSMFKEQ